MTALLEQPELIRVELDRRRQESLRNDPLEQRQAQLMQELTRVEQQIDKLLDAYQEGLVQLAQLRQRMPGLRRRQKTAQTELENTRWQALDAEKANQLEQSLSGFLSRLRESTQSLGISERQKVIRLLIKDIVVEVDNRITIRHCLPLKGGDRDASSGSTHCYPLCTGRNVTRMVAVVEALLAKATTWKSLIAGAETAATEPEKDATGMGSAIRV